MFIIKWLFKKPAYLIAIIGAALILSASIVTKASDDFLTDAQATTATICDMSETKKLSNEPKVIVRYVVDGKEYERPLNYYEPGMSEGLELNILYDPNLPERIKSPSTDTAAQSKKLRTYGWTLIGIAGVLVVFKIIGKIKKEREKKAAKAAKAAAKAAKKNGRR